MGLVAAIAILTLAGCYAPTLRDCSVSCATASDCADGQGCTAAGWCAAEGATCTASGPNDASIDAPAPADARADARADAMVPTAQLKVMIMGPGQVLVDGVGTCAMASCTYTVPATGQLTAHAMMTNSQHAFDKWTDLLCKDQGATCTFSVFPVTTIQAAFK